MARARLVSELLDERDPDGIALFDADHAVTWSALRIGADAVAAGLARALPPRARVAVIADRSATTYAAILGIWRAGCVYVPVDPAQPAERVGRILRASQPGAVIVAADRAALTEVITAAAPEALVLPLATSLAEMEVRSPHGNPEAQPGIRRIVDEDLAYIFFTSGSTGEPKGVMIAHRSLFAYAHWVKEHASLTPNDRILAHPPLHFDLAIYPLAGALASGAALVGIPRALEGNAAEVARLVQTHGLSVWISAPYLLTLFTTALRLDQLSLPALRHVAYVGEVLPNRTLIAWMQRFPSARFFNLYGPTEATVTCTGHEYTSVPAVDDPISIGRAHDNCEILLLDDEGRTITKPNEPGEINIHGGCVARGYHNRPDLTERAFVSLGERTSFLPAYKTGDLAYYDDSGDLIFVGRRDHQVKIRGFRVELGEIEAALTRHPRVRAAAVVAIPHGAQGELVVVAFVELAPGPALGEPALRKHVTLELPRYMVPHRIVAAELPRGAAGKIDRGALTARAGALLAPP